MRVVIAPDKFAGTLTAARAADAIRTGWLQQRPDDDVVVCPMADGGPGTLDVVEAAVGGERHTVEVSDATGHAATAAWLALPDGRALVESAQACGLDTVAAADRNPRTTTTYGVGQLLRAAADDAAEVIVTLGGSATVDGGAGMAIALGHRLLRSDRNGVKIGGEHLPLLRTILPAAPLPARVVVAADVDAPLLGPDGAVAGFAAQKGAGPEDLPVLESALTVLADVAERDLPGGPWRDLPGAGAAGGLGFGLAAFAGANLVAGAELVAELIGLPDAIAAADVVVTGEGRLDPWSLRGKATGAVLRLARDRGARALAVVGSAADGAGTHFDAVAELGPAGLDAPTAAVAAHAGQLAATFSRG